MYGLLLDPAKACSRDHLRSELAKRGIETRTFFIPIHLQPIYFDQFRGQRFPVAESLCANGLYLPTSEAISEADAGWISQQIRDIVAGSAA
jgi:perosamine synthetase